MESSDKYIILQANENEIAIIDANSISADPDITECFYLENQGFHNTAMKLDGDNAIIGIANILYRIDLNGENNPEIVSESAMPANILACEIFDDTVAVYIEGRGILVYRFENDSLLDLICEMESGNEVYRMIYNEGFLYTVDRFSNINILDIEENRLEIIHQIHSETEDDVADLEIFGDYIYIASKRNGLRIIDISDKSMPEELVFQNSRLSFAGRFIDLGPFMNEITVSTDSSLICVDIFDIKSPRIIRKSSFSGSIEGMCIIGKSILISIPSQNYIKILE
ncbi:MAG: hypothetical protein SVK54_04085, partial [candidate division WOR-3 bacterium]|nr:hypothetical protein [candidate division WOR-3 bacterium]